MNTLKIKTGLKISLLKSENEFTSSILIESNREMMQKLGEFLIELSQQQKTKSFSTSPDGAGSAYFDQTSEFGIYALLST